MTTVLSTLPIAEGAIGADATQRERLDELTQRLAAGEFFVPVDGTLPTKCIDGRPGARGIAPNSAGGTESLMVADDLTTKRFAADDQTTLGAYQAILATLQDKGLSIGGHTDDHAEGVLSGCGANDKLALIYDFLARQGEGVRELALALGVVVNDETHTLIVENAAARTSFSAGSELLAALKQAGGTEVVDPLEGTHNEVVTVINGRRGTTLDRAALAAVFGTGYQTFNVDTWSFQAAAEAISTSPEEAARKVVAMAYYNIATAGVLCGPHMRTVVLG